MAIKLFSVLIFLIVQITLANDEISIALEDSDNAPLEKVLPDKKVVGFHIEMITAVADSINKKIKWVPLPWSRAIDSANKGGVDAITYISENKARAEHLIFLKGNELHTDMICVFMRKNFDKNKFNGTLESLFGEKVGTAKDYFLTKEIEEKKHKFNLMEVATVGEQLYTMLVAGRIDYVFGSRFSLKRVIQKQGLNAIELAGPCNPGEKRFVAFSKAKLNSGKNAKTFEDAMLNWKKTPAYQKLKEKYEI